MAPTLQDLPAEILMLICDSDVSKQQSERLDDCHEQWYQKRLYERQRRLLYENLRLTCKEIDAKIVRYYAQSWHTNGRVELCEADLKKFQIISRGQLAFHVQSVTFSSRSLVEQKEMNYSSDSSNASSHGSWYPQERENASDWSYTHYSFQERNFEFLLGGRSAKLLSSFLPMMPNLKHVQIAQPLRLSEVRDSKLEEIQARWTLAVKIIMSAVLSNAVPLEVLKIGDCRDGQAIHSSVLEHFAIHASKLKALKFIGLNISVSDSQVDIDHQARILVSILTTASKLEDLTIGFAFSTRAPVLFKQFTKSVGPLTLRRLHLFQLKTRKTYLRKLLFATQSTLEALTLDFISMDGVWNFDLFLSVYFSNSLKELTLSHIDVDGEGLLFDNISWERPTCLSYSSFGFAEDDWIFVNQEIRPRYEVSLKHEDGDYIHYWLKELNKQAIWGEAWTSENTE